jgi:hypothetical protein
MILDLKYEYEPEGAAMRKTGPNNIRRVVWAKGTCFFFFCVLLILTYVFLFFLGSIYVIKGRAGLGWLAMMIMGPAQDASFGPKVCVFLNFILCFAGTLRKTTANHNYYHLRPLPPPSQRPP